MMIDIFNHFMPKAYLDRLGDLIPGHAVLTAFPHLKTLWDVDARRALMDEFPGTQHVLSLANPPPELIGPASGTAELVRFANDALAEVCWKNPDHFPAFIASLPMNDVEASVREIDRAVTELGARGVQVFTNVAGKPLSALEFRPVFQRMAAHDLPVWVHPMRSAQFSDYVSEAESQNEIWFSFGWPYETTACMTRLIYSGIFDELPALKIISHHMGGMIPYFPSKIKLGFQQIFFGSPNRNPAAEQAGLKRPPLDYFKMLYADTALGEVAPTRCGHAFFGTEHCLFATDAPFDSEQGRGLMRSAIAAVDALEISQAEKDAIFEGNARKLLRL
ncbi:MAG: amidohydrolase [Rhizobiales bacterium]|nr:amidohydrolase [Hyphomicrobiales bacterium]